MSKSPAPTKLSPKSEVQEHPPVPARLIEFLLKQYPDPASLISETMTDLDWQKVHRAHARREVVDGLLRAVEGN